MKIGILRETKDPPDRRVPLTPQQCAELNNIVSGLNVVIQPSEYRCYTDKEYRAAGLSLQEDLSDCDLLMGVKEVDMETLLPGKTYLFFSHTAKEQPYNRTLLQEISKKEITLIDYEYLTRKDNSRVVAFGRWAGIVGAYNGLMAYGLRTGKYSLERAWKLSGLAEMKERMKGLPLGDCRIVITGGGRVASGAVEILEAAGIPEQGPEDYVINDKPGARFCRLDPWHYTKHSEGKPFEFNHFINHPGEYENNFLPYARRSDLFMACHFWDPDSPILLAQEDLMSAHNTLEVIADISCDINGPIASTIRPSTIAHPVYGYNPETGLEALDPLANDIITVMAVDNLPGELPRDASEDFGRALLDHVIPALTGGDPEGIVDRATILRKGKLTHHFDYLGDYLSGPSVSD